MLNALLYYIYSFARTCVVTLGHAMCVEVREQHIGVRSLHQIIWLASIIFICGDALHCLRLTF